MRNQKAAVVLVTLLSLVSSAVASSATAQPLRERQLAADVESALLRLPYYDVFDNLGYELPGRGTVRLTGQVRTPWLKSSAEKAVKRVSGVDTVVNEIEVLPASINDDRIRSAVYRSLFYDSCLEVFGFGYYC
jgi:hypothetical protein